MLLVRMATTPATIRHALSGTTSLVPKDVCRGLASLTTTANVNGGKWLEACKTTPLGQHGTAAKTLKYWSGVQCQTRGLFGQCRTGGLAVTKQALKPGLSNPFWVQSAGYVAYPPYIILDTAIRGGIPSVRVITIHGVLDQDVHNFVVSLETTREEHADVPFHMMARFKEKMLTISKKTHGEFEKDGAVVHKSHFPFTPGQPFTLSVHVTPAEFRLVINNVNFDTFKHNITRQVIQENYFRVYGRLDVTHFSLE
ncbi:galectin-related protein A-like [Physella acuta]|uniref:galectin-related protein A-like n=1 Tax=Physella acuta TaxID=109671 RepID=UPI0027DDD47F|nr:galectin-related protein A-like [Physella acuta]